MKAPKLERLGVFIFGLSAYMVHINNKPILNIAYLAYYFQDGSLPDRLSAACQKHKNACQLRGKQHNF
jgi:hypothetical protein